MNGTRETRKTRKQGNKEDREAGAIANPNPKSSIPNPKSQILNPNPQSQI
ncbi:hypothetical protein F7734_48600 [Scytonema sp. UIC 10036]|nr:hypothetical protein [Scytonema sp. UIC 10036]MUG99731.1 hypothetical protein [Scytonema sp. UIC 10036]